MVDWLMTGEGSYGCFHLVSAKELSATDESETNSFGAASDDFFGGFSKSMTLLVFVVLLLFRVGMKNEQNAAVMAVKRNLLLTANLLESTVESRVCAPFRMMTSHFL
jgi:hypothetical protein